MARTIRNAKYVSLLINPGTPEQRALHVVIDREDRREYALAKARAKYGDDTAFGWLAHDNGELVKS